MTYLSKDIADHLKASTNIQDFFGVAVYDERIPQNTKLTRAIVINDISHEPVYSLAGEVGTHESIIQIDVWTDGQGGKKLANDGAEFVRNRLSGYRGQFGSGCYGTAQMIRDDSLAAPPIDGSDVHRRRISMDFKIIHTADVPTFT